MYLAFIFGVSILILTIDLMVPLGVAGGVPYIIIVLLSYKVENKKAIYFTAVLGSVLTILGFFLSPAGGELWKVLANRFLALFAIWTVAIACVKNKKREESIHILTEAMNQSPNPVAITDKEANIEYVNSAFLNKTGYSREELLGQNPRILKSGKHPPEFYSDLWKTIKSGNVWTGDIFNRRKNGTLYWETLQISPLKDIKGEISHYFSLRLLDKQRELADKEVNKLTHTLDQVPQGILMTDVDGFIIFANPAFEKITVYSLNDVIGMNPNLLKSGTQTPEFYKQLWEVIFTGKPWRGVLKNKKKNGQFYWESVVISPVVNDVNKITHFISIRDDITLEKEKEFQLQKVQKQLLTSEKLAGIGQLAAGVSHEVLNPVNIISVRNQMLKRKHEKDPEISEFASKMDFEIKRIQKILSSLLAFSRASSKELENCTLSEVVEDVLVLVEDEFKLDSIEIKRNWGESIDLLLDKDKMRQVVFNLLNNAKYAMPKGGVITVGCNEVDRKGQNFCQFVFSDTGVGMNEEVKSKAFDPFFTTKPEGEGTGIGLSVIHGIVKDHEGHIFIESEEGKGTTFILEFPIHEQSLQESFSKY
ncbi:MAG: PAS domain S-box protein [Nitrospinota bacterium]